MEMARGALTVQGWEFGREWDRTKLNVGIGAGTGEGGEITRKIAS